MARQRDIYLSPFPFSDEETEKLRPVLVVTGSVHNSMGLDVVVMAITSNLQASISGINISVKTSKLVPCRPPVVYCH